MRSVLSRIDAYCPKPVQRIGLSATVSNPAQLLEWFAPCGERQVVGLSTISTDAEVTVDAVGTLDNAATVVSRLHRCEKRLVFCDSRSAAEQREIQCVSRQLPLELCGRSRFLLHR